MTLSAELKVAALFSAAVAGAFAVVAVAAHLLGVSVVTSDVDVDVAHVAVVGVIPAFVGAWLFCAGRRLAFRSAGGAAVVAASAASVGVVVHDLLLRSTYYVTNSPLSVFAGDISIGGCFVGVRDTSGAWPVYAAVVVGAAVVAAATQRWASASRRRR